MSIVATEIECVHGSPGQQRLVWYRCQDDQGEWHRYGPLHDYDGTKDLDAFKAVVAARVADQLAEIEVKHLLGG